MSNIWSGHGVSNNSVKFDNMWKKNCVDPNTVYLIIVSNLTTYFHLFMSFLCRIIRLYQILLGLDNMSYGIKNYIFNYESRNVELLKKKK